jgi:hypothetical protein
MLPRVVSTSALTVLAGVLCLMVARPVRADARITLAGRICASEATDLERRLASAPGGQSSPELSASVSFEQTKQAIRVTVAVREGRAARGETAFVVSTCQEAVDAVVVVLGLAFSAEASDSRHADDVATALVELPRASGGDVAAQSDAPSSNEREARTRAGATVTRGSSRLSLGGGVDVGTMPNATAFVAGGITHSLSAVDLRGSLRYGLPTEDERVESGIDQSIRREYGAMGLSACYGVGGSVHLLACAGGELSLVRNAHRLEVEGSSSLDRDELSARVSGVLGAVLSRREGWIQPEIELAGSALALGRRNGTPPIAVRAAAGAAVNF